MTSRHQETKMTTKQPVGERLALWALGTAYGRTLTYSGPLYRDMNVRGRKVCVRFDHVDKELSTSDGEPPVNLVNAAGLPASPFSSMQGTQP